MTSPERECMSDYRQEDPVVFFRNSPVSVVAFHTQVEKVTEQLAFTIAQLGPFNLYLHRVLGDWTTAHIPSTTYNHSALDKLFLQTAVAISVHGARDTDSSIQIGGLNDQLTTIVSQTFTLAGFAVKEPRPGIRGKHKENVVNRPMLHGIQLEVSRGLREVIENEKDKNTAIQFAQAVQSGIQIYASRLHLFV